MIQFIKSEQDEGGGRLIHAKDLFRLQGVCRLRLVAGQAGLERRARAAVLFEYDEERVGLSDFYRGDLVVSTLEYARDDRNLVTSSMLALIAQGIAGFIIKTAYYDALPQEVLQAADASGTPVFLFDETYIEEVILEITELIRGRHHFSGYERDLDELMNGSLSTDQIREKVRRIDPSWSGRGRLYAISWPGRAQQLSERLFRWLEQDEAKERDCVFMSWRWMMLALVHPAEDDTPGGEFRQLDEILSCAGVSDEPAAIGASNVYTAPERMGFALCEAVYAMRTAQVRHVSRLPAWKLGMHAYLMPLSRDMFARERCREVIERLREYDRRNHTNIEQTVREYVRNDMQIAPTAKALFQHPNTVRYRLGKIKRCLGIEEDTAFEVLISLTVGMADILEVLGEY